ncbi:hypothetical protein [Pseudorhodoferax sp.]
MGTPDLDLHLRRSAAGASATTPGRRGLPADGTRPPPAGHAGGIAVA